MRFWKCFIGLRFYKQIMPQDKNKKIKYCAFTAGSAVIIMFTVLIIVKWKPIERKIPDIMGIEFTLPWEEKQEYELLVKKVQTGSGPGAYQPGDIVAIKPAGYVWASGEIANFDIVKLELTERQVEELLRPKEAKEKDESGTPEIEARRKYYIELPSSEIGGKKQDLDVSLEEVQKR